jgi:DNA-binding NarL/FixJ family response regulator
MSIECSVTRIIIVDDHPVVREGLRAVLSRESQFEVCGDVGTAAAALDLVRSQSPDVAVVDILLDNENGLDLIYRLKSLSLGIRMLACSMYDEHLYAERALAAGAMGYLNKREASRKIIEVIRTIMGGEVYLNEATKQDIINRRVACGPLRPTAPIESLSNRELEIFRLIGHGMTPSEIGESMDLNAKTIDKYSLKIRRLLQLKSNHKLTCEAVHWVLENG